MRISLSDFVGKRVHFVGIGGTGMSGLARIMSTYSIEVSGSDMKESSVLTGLRAIGAKVSSNHDSKNADGADFLVFSSAISESNPEMKRARELKIPILSRAQALSALMSESTAVAVAGTLGKTTTTSMLTVAAQSCGEDPSFAIGGTLSASGSNAHRGTGDFFIAEADESDGSFVEYQPYGAVITNIEHDHVDYFKTPESVMEAFESFVGTIASDGFLVYCADDAGSQALGNSVKNIRKISYGTHADSDLRIDSIELLPQGSKARALWNGKSIGTLDLQVPGHHNVLNASAALAGGLALGLPSSQLIAGLATFRGTGRRFELKGQVQGIRVIDDYGHHPTEIRVTLATAKRYATDGRVLVVFQPHRYSRTQAFIPEFAEALDIADQAWVLEVYGASEEPIAGISAESITKRMNHGIFEPNFLTATEAVVAHARPGDVILTLGAGDVSSLAPIIVEALAKKFPQ